MNQLFYCPDIQEGFARLDEEESRHLLVVLRRQAGDRLQLTDGKGFFYEAEIAETGKKYALARILERRPAPQPAPALHVAIAPTKQIERFEWFLEKATEIGIRQITPLLCRRSERNNIRHDRLEKVLVSAMKQSLQAQMPLLAPLTPFNQLIASATEAGRFLAWCADEPLPHLKTLLRPGMDTLVLIGPEGDFAPEEVALALANGFAGVSLGATRLRTETAGLLAVAAQALS
ncbi:MAG: 16S rRNA (uracil(1498)-N(3))-methyltransferase [Saprospiraceae bacterium]|nr:16S rRNA (uracil(1498)-N(3))-methyltransferase [Saprospiraceae bacterium]